mmetsp:Transcript_24043/g.59621  ORF Transcript_24043/g.59621 Transcript_24043/m.59621 type:complete len:289 (+) Transcript_24043:207-1073(+)
MEFTLEPPRKTRVKPWAAVVRLTPAMLACLEGQGSGAASITLSATDNVLRIGNNSFNFTCIPEEVPGDLVRGSLELCEEPCRRSGVQRGLEMETGTEKVGAPPRSLEVAGSLQCRLQPKRVMAGSDGLAASVKRRVEEKVAEKESRKAVLVDYIAPAAVATTTTAAALLPLPTSTATATRPRRPCSAGSWRCGGKRRAGPEAEGGMLALSLEALGANLEPPRARAAGRAAQTRRIRLRSMRRSHARSSSSSTTWQPQRLPGRELPLIGRRALAHCFPANQRRAGWVPR